MSSSTIQRLTASSTIRYRYAFYAPQENSHDCTWYISPPLDEMNCFDKLFIVSIKKYFIDHEREDGEGTSGGSLVHTRVIAFIANIMRHIPDANAKSYSYEDVNEVMDLDSEKIQKDLNIFGNDITLVDGMKMLTHSSTGWLVLNPFQNGGTISLNKELAKLSNQFQLIINQINDC